ncbi:MULTISPECIES: hypothetical protein [unclassified Acinetobacter]|uniref:hypothetical protein n=1 Tax=unclassified Acinetobacter TaxID=196816 RepID=UPI00293442CE|nr:MULTISPECIES: hypothetical protein [unclassified Acinetobacter]WOE32753.1 hypothetical protein QSG84_06135 [Acinetobacter sp. SAAs470]WOE38230.1 hypothetical protein QSG86_15190 [Acinetobacter sp. SAAs474]
MSWQNRPTDFINTVISDTEQHVKKISADMLQTVITGSPVMDGSFRNSNLITINQPTYHYIEGEGNRAPRGTLDQKAFDRGTKEILKIKLGDSVYLTNALPYSVKIENGHSDQTPEGVYALAFQSVSSKYK